METKNLTEMSFAEMELTMGGCGWCTVIDIAAACIKGIAHALR